MTLAPHEISGLPADSTILVTGARDWVDYTAVLRSVGVVIGSVPGVRFRHGAARGLDTHVDRAVREILGAAAPSRLDVCPVTAADWATKGKIAGILRNEEMVQKVPRPALTLGWPTRSSSGTWHCMQHSVENGIPTLNLALREPSYLAGGASAVEVFRGPAWFLSNFAPTPVFWQGTWWPTSEHAYQAAKAVDPRARQAFLQAKSPGDAKRLGRNVQIRSDWDAVKVTVMREVLAAKFSWGRSDWLADRLALTSDAVLCEGNGHHDQFWGNCRCAEHWFVPGENWLGKLLMERRMTLQSDVRRACTT